MRWFNIGATRFPPHTFGPGEYRSEPTDGLAPAELLRGDYQENRKTCGLTLQVTDARLTLSRFDESAAVGSLEARLDDGTELAGEFMAPSCPLVQTSVAGANEALPICTPQ